jgi:hypothetical protein
MKNTLKSKMPEYEKNMRQSSADLKDKEEQENNFIWSIRQESARSAVHARLYFVYNEIGEIA